MVFWSILAALTAGAIAFVAWPFLVRPRQARSGTDVAVYQDQLDEIERDRKAGLIGDDESEAARLEVSRRLLKAAGKSETAGQAQPGVARSARTAALAAALLVIPGLSAALYYRLGAPQAAAPKVAGGKPAAGSIEEMIGKVEAHLAKNPDDGRSWEVLAPVYMRLGRYEASAEAWRNVIRLQGETADRLESLGESLVAVADGVVTDDARKTFDRALSLDKDAVAARYYRGLAAVQDGRNEEAARIWRDLLASAPQGASWTASVQQSLDRLEAGQSGGPRASGEPDARQMEEAAKLPHDQQDEMVRGMVEKLAARLKLNGDDPEGWIKLVRSYRALGAADKSAQARADARKALSASAVKLAMFEEGVKDIEEAPPAPSAAPATPAEQSANSEMIKGMVDRLAERLKQNGDDPDGWVRLVRSYGVIGDPEKAKAALADARKALAADADKLKRFEDGVRSLGQ